MKKVFIRTFGCQMNEYDSEKMLAVLAEENGGIEQVTEADEADIILFNTCSVRSKKKIPTSSSALPAALPHKKAKTSSNARLMWTSSSARKRCTACPK